MHACKNAQKTTCNIEIPEDLKSEALSSNPASTSHGKSTESKHGSPKRCSPQFPHLSNRGGDDASPSHLRSKLSGKQTLGV